MACRFPLVLSATVLLAAACADQTAVTAPALPDRPSFTISDAVHSGGLPGFYWLPPMVSAPTLTGTFDPDLATLAPQIVICDVTAGPDTDCGGATASLATFGISSTPAITVDPTSQQYQVNWDTKGTAFQANHTYRIHTKAGTLSARRELGFADILLTATPGQVKDVATGDLIVLNDGRTLPIKFRIETGIQGAIAVTMTPSTVKAGSNANASATVLDLHSAALSGSTVAWTATGALSSLSASTGITTSTGTTAVQVTAGASAGTAFITASSNGLSATGALVITPASVNEWSVGTSMPTARRAFGGMINGKLYVAGGLLGVAKTLSNLLEAYDVAAGTWQTLAPMPTARADAAAAVLDGKLYVVGGWDATNTPLATVEVYDPATGTWTTKAPLPRGRGYPAAAAFDGKLYVFGGLIAPVSSQVVPDVDVYEPSTNSWTSGAPMPVARFVQSAAALNGSIYLVGGYDQDGYGKGLGTVDAYNPVTNTWTSKQPMNYRRGQTPAVGVMDGKLYVAGGFCFLCWLYYPGGNGPAGYLNVVESYDPDGDAWSVLAPLPAARFGQTAGVFNGRLYLAGGERDFEVMASDLQIYIP